jgi:hypothetical protein
MESLIESMVPLTLNLANRAIVTAYAGITGYGCQPTCYQGQALETRCFVSFDV